MGDHFSIIKFDGAALSQNKEGIEYNTNILKHVFIVGHTTAMLKELYTGEEIFIIYVRDISLYI